MYKYSELLTRIIRRYKLEEGSILTLEYIQEISKNENILIKDLRILFEIDSNKWYCLKKGLHKYVKLKFNMYEKLENKSIFDKGQIDYEDFIRLKEELHISSRRLRIATGLYSSLYRKLRDGQIDKARIIDMEIKHKVKLIILDIHYLPKYKPGYYSMDKLLKICKERKITLDNFLRYYNNNPKCYKFAKLAIEKTKKIWIGQIKIPDKFIIANYETLMKKLKKVANNESFKYNCKHIKEDLIEGALVELYEKHGNIVKLFYFNNTLTLNILAKKAKYFIINMCKKENKESKNLYYNKLADYKLDHSKIFKDYKHSPNLLF